MLREKWLHRKDNQDKIDEAVDWALKNKPSENFDEVIQRIENDQYKD